MVDHSLEAAAREHILIVILVSMCSFVIISITPPIFSAVAFLASLAFSVFVGYNIAELIDRKFKDEVRPDNPTVFISGCDCGIGLHVARKLLELNFRVFAGCLDVRSDGAAILKQHQVPIIPIDYLESHTIVDGYKRLMELLDGKDLWAIVANAGVMNYGEMEWMTFDDLKWVIQVNLTGTIRFVKQGIPLIRRSRGRIVIIAGAHGRLSPPGTLAYNVSQAGLISFADGLRRELAKWGAHVCTVEPTVYKTRISDLDNVRAALNDVFARLRPELHSGYNASGYLDTFRNLYTRRLHRVTRTNLNEVSRGVSQALLDSLPKPRYQCGGLEILLWNLLELLPTEVVDGLMISWLQPRIDLNRAKRRSIDKTSPQQKTATSKSAKSQVSESPTRRREVPSENVHQRPAAEIKAM